MPRRRLIAAVALSLVTLMPTFASGWEPMAPSLPRWQTLPVPYKVNLSSIPPEISDVGLARVQAGFATWTAPMCSAFRSSYSGDTTQASFGPDGENVIYWVSSNWPAQLGDVNTLIGVTRIAFIDDQMVDADIVFNNVGFCWNDTGVDGCVDVQSLATHEVGHFLGLDHTTVADATMVSGYPGGTSHRTLESDDIAGVCSLYPSMGRGYLCESCATSGQCPDAYSDCSGNLDCGSYQMCIDGCHTDSCRSACVGLFPEGAQLFDALRDCVCTQCATDCADVCEPYYPPDAGVPDAGVPDAGALDAGVDLDASLGSGESGGCGVTGGAPCAPATWLIVAIVVLLSRRRRRDGWRTSREARGLSVALFWCCRSGTPDR